MWCCRPFYIFLNREFSSGAFSCRIDWGFTKYGDRIFYRGIGLGCTLLLPCLLFMLKVIFGFAVDHYSQKL